MVSVFPLPPQGHFTIISQNGSVKTEFWWCLCPAQSSPYLITEIKVTSSQGPRRLCVPRFFCCSDLIFQDSAPASLASSHFWNTPGKELLSQGLVTGHSLCLEMMFPQTWVWLVPSLLKLFLNVSLSGRSSALCHPHSSSFFSFLIFLLGILTYLCNTRCFTYFSC